MRLWPWAPPFVFAMAPAPPRNVPAAPRSVPLRAVARRLVVVGLPSALLLPACGVLPACAEDRTERARAMAEADGESPMIRRLRAASEDKADERRAERLADYNKRNFGDYFAAMEPKRSSDMTENDKKIAAWVEQNK